MHWYERRNRQEGFGGLLLVFGEEVDGKLGLSASHGCN